MHWSCIILLGILLSSQNFSRFVWRPRGGRYWLQNRQIVTYRYFSSTSLLALFHTFLYTLIFIENLVLHLDSHSFRPPFRNFDVLSCFVTINHEAFLRQLRCSFFFDDYVSHFAVQSSFLSLKTSNHFTFIKRSHNIFLTVLSLVERFWRDVEIKKIQERYWGNRFNV